MMEIILIIICSKSAYSFLGNNNNSSSNRRAAASPYLVLPTYEALLCVTHNYSLNAYSNTKREILSYSISQMRKP